MIEFVELKVVMSNTFFWIIFGGTAIVAFYFGAAWRNRYWAERADTGMCVDNEGKKYKITRAN